MNRLFDPECVPARIRINKRNLIPKQIVSGVVRCSERAEVWIWASRMSRSCSLILGAFRLPKIYFDRKSNGNGPFRFGLIGIFGTTSGGGPL